MSEQRISLEPIVEAIDAKTTEIRTAMGSRQLPDEQNAQQAVLVLEGVKSIVTALCGPPGQPESFCCPYSRDQSDGS